MSEKEATKPENSEEPQKPRRRVFTPRNALFVGVFAAALLLLVVIISFVAYRTGVFNTYVKGQFVSKMSDIGIVFDADVFRVTINPLELELKNATFIDRFSGEKLFFIRDAHLELSVKDLYAWQLSRDISIVKTDVNGAEVWVKFDENGRSNFSNLKLVEDQAGSRVNFKYDSADFSIRNSVVNFGDESRDISGNAKNVAFLLLPENRDVAEDQRRYKFDLTSTDSTFSYAESKVEDIDIRASGIADRNGAEISNFELKTPIAESTLSGTLTDWAAPKYSFDITSSVDLTQASGILPIGATLVGVGNFKGKVTGEGESYRVEGEADAASLRAAGVSLKGVNVAATVEGTNSNYEANGTAIAEMMTFEDFRVDFLKLVGNVRGTGTDFRWVGELQAAAAKSKSVTLGGLFLSDAMAEFKDKQLRAESGSGRVKRFAVGDKEFADLSARNLKFSLDNGYKNLSSPNAQAKSFTTKNFSLHGLSGRNIRIKDKDGRTDVIADSLRSDTATIKDSKLKDLSADKFDFVDFPNSTDITITNLRAGLLNNDGTIVSGLETPEMYVKDTPAETVIYSDKLRVAKIDTGSATLGSLNIAGVRLLIKQGRVRATSDDIDAGNVAITKKGKMPAGILENVKISQPVFVLEPSGRYRATADMSLGGGAIGSVALGSAKAKVVAINDSFELNELTAEIMEGRFNGKASIARNERGRSALTGDFSALDIAKLLATQTGGIVPIDGQTTGTVDLAFNGTDLGTATGKLDATITASGGTTDKGFIPVNGEIKFTALHGLFDVTRAFLKTDKTTFEASGRAEFTYFDIFDDVKDENSNLTVSLRSTDASEVHRLVRVVGLSQTLEERLDLMQAQFAGNLTFDGTITGDLFRPTIEDGRAALDSLSLRGRKIGSVSTDIDVSPTLVELTNGKLQDRTGGSAVFSVNIPVDSTNNTAVTATLTNMNAGNLLAALPIDMPARIADLNGQISGTVDIRGLPDSAQGEINLAAARGIIAGQPFDDLKVKAVFSGTLIDLQQADMRIGAGRFTATGNYDRGSDALDLRLTGTALPVPLLVALVPNSESLPPMAGDVDFTANATKTASVPGRPAKYDVTFNGGSPDVRVNETSLGQVAFKGQTANQVLTADLTASLDGNPQVINASVNFANENLPFMVATDFNQSPIAPFLSFIPQMKGLPITGTGTGRVEFGGDLSQIDAKGVRVYSAANLSGKAEFSQLALPIQDTPLAAAEPVLVRF